MKQIRHIDKCPADNLPFHFFNQFPLLGMPLLFCERPNEYQPATMVFRRFVKLPFRRGDAFFIFIAIKIAEQAQIDIGLPCLFQIDFLRTIFRGRRLLEDDRLEETGQKIIRPNIIAEFPPFL